MSQKLIKRDYLDKLIAFKDTSFIKIITGIRRSGKSKLLDLMIEYLIENGTTENQIIKMNFESYIFKNYTDDDVYNYIKERVVLGKKMYIFLDEIHKVQDWENVVNGLRVDFDSDIYITGSNAYLLSSEYATYLSGRTIEIKLLPLSFREFAMFNDYSLHRTKTLAGDNYIEILDSDNKTVDRQQLFDAYMKFGGFPSIREIGLNQESVLTMLDGIYETVIHKDIMQRSSRDLRKITDEVLLDKIIYFLADNIGNNVSYNKTREILKNEGLLNYKDTLPSVNTIGAYVKALQDAYVFYEIKRFDIKGREYLRTLGKYYIVDTGLRNYLLGYKLRDVGHVIENIVYFELLRRGYDVAIGKIKDLEIDFIAVNKDERVYIQVSQSISDDKVKERELKPLKMVEDNYKKMVITLDCNYETNIDGIEIVNIIDWLLDK